jgi:phage terminase large subunit-like protein
LEETYGGTRLGLQELEGEILDDIEGALWTSELIEQQMRCAEPPTVFERIVIAVDPSWGRGTGGDEVGIIAAGKSRGVAYILADRSGRMRPNAWGRVAAELYDELEADRMIAEANFQAEQVKLVAMTLNTDPNYEGGRVTFHEVHASRGKRLRAEPVVGLCEQGRVKIVGQMPLLEHQLTHWVPPEIGDDGDDKGDPEDSEPAAMEVNSTDTPTPSDFSPDRLDAMVFAVTDLLLGVSGKARLSRPSGTIPGVRTGGGQLGRRPGARVVSHD